MNSMIRIYGNEQASFQNKPQKFRNAITNSINIDKPEVSKSNCIKMESMRLGIYKILQ